MRVYGEDMASLAGKEWRPLSRALQKRAARLHTSTGRHKTGLFLIEGFRLLAAALENNWPIESVVVRDDSVSRARLKTILAEWGKPAVGIYSAPRKILEEMSATVSSSGVIALARQKPFPPASEPPSGRHLLIVDNVRDPGNVGAILRSAAAFGIDAVYLSAGSVDLYNPKVVRGSMGALFSLPVYPNTDLHRFSEQLHQAGYAIFIADPHEGRPPDRAETPAKWALVVGGETKGYSDSWRKGNAESVRIPTSAKVESLNTAVAAGIILFCLGKPQLRSRQNASRVRKTTRQWQKKT